LALGVGRRTCADSFGSPRLFHLPRNRSTASSATGVCHKPDAVAVVRGTDASSRQYGRPDGVVFTFQVSKHKVEPRPGAVRNLLAKDNWRAADLDEVKPEGPQVPLVSKLQALACRGERLARRRAGPNTPVVGPSCELQGDIPSRDSSEEVAAGELGKIGGFDILYWALIDLARGYKFIGY
jgi:hypothetical protein